VCVRHRLPPIVWFCNFILPCLRCRFYTFLLSHFKKKWAISADTQGAITQFNELGDSQNRFVKSLEDADKALGKANLDAFADKQALARAAITATRGETEALSSSVKAYQSRIESLIKQGISPENEEIQKLVKEEERLKKELEDTAAAHRLQENTAKGAATALAVIAAAAGAATAGSVKAAAKVVPTLNRNVTSGGIGGLPPFWIVFLKT
jgi:hypothetical protein